MMIKFSNFQTSKMNFDVDCLAFFGLLTALGYFFKNWAILVTLIWNTSKAMFVGDRLVLPECKQHMTSLRGQASWAKMTSLRGKLTATACHLTKFVNKAELQTFLSTNLDQKSISSNKLECYISLGWIGLPETNTLAYWTHL